MVLFSWMQFLKQMYVLVLGLDVLGNPFGLIRGLSEGVEAFFYEPFQVPHILFRDDLQMSFNTDESFLNNSILSNVLIPSDPDTKA